jgi:hypothetical protein
MNVQLLSPIAFPGEATAGNWDEILLTCRWPVTAEWNWGHFGLDITKKGARQP